jgi:hypothetical protein
MTSTSKTSSSSKRDLKASVLDACCTYFLYLSIGLHDGSFYFLGIHMCYTFPCNILVTWDLGRILVIFTTCLAASMRLTIGIG